MSPILLIDLDDTLLENSIETFLPAYLKALSKHLSNHLQPEVMIRELLRATDQMLVNQNPQKTLEEVFDETFYPAVKVSKEELKPVIESFYRRVFPTLKSITRPKPEAKALIEYALKKGWKIVVATNPIFPLTAIEQRLEWAGLSPKEVPFDLITSYETFHFAKPNPAYYAEMLAHLGWKDEPVVMVGNSMSDDIRPAVQTGIPAFWLSDTAPDEDAYSPSSWGTFSEVYPFLEQIEYIRSTSILPSLNGLIGILRATLAFLDSQRRAVPLEDWNQKPSAEEWCLTEIICHLRDSDREVNLPRFRKILEEENPFLPAVNADEWSSVRQYCNNEEPLEALQGFIQARLEILSILESLSPEAWKRPARHAIFGPTTLQELVIFMCAHDRDHIQQVHKTIPK